MKDEKGKSVGDKKGASSMTNKKALALLLKRTCPTPWNTGSLRLFHRATDRGIKILANTAQVEHHKEGASGYI